MKRTSAFTLLEMSLAMVAGAVVLAAIFGIFSKAVHLRDDATARMRGARLRAHAVNVLRNDLRNARISGGTDRTLAATLEGSQQTHGAGFPGYLKFSTTTAPDDRDDPSADVQEVEYYIVNDPDAQNRKAGLLVRSANRDLLATTRGQAVEEPLLAGVSALDVEFFDGTEWKGSWSYDSTNAKLPTAVRVTLQTTNSAPVELMVPWTTQTIVEATDSTTTK